jgi:hypothetical protein
MTDESPVKTDLNDEESRGASPKCSDDETARSPANKQRHVASRRSLLSEDTNLLNSTVASDASSGDESKTSRIQPSGNTLGTPESRNADDSESIDSA